MISRISNTQWVFIWLGFFVMAFIVFYPQLSLLHDEYSYFNRSLALSNFNTEFSIPDITNTESINLSGSRYLPGTLILIALQIAIFGNASAFLIGLFCFAISVFLNLRILQKLELNPLGAIILFTFPPLLMLSRTLMSGMPSLLITSIFFYLLICKKRTHSNFFLLGLIAGLSLLFRETNALIVAPFLAFVVFAPLVRQEGNSPLPHSRATRTSEMAPAFFTLLGGLIAIALRLMLSKIIYGDYFFKSSADSFSLMNMLVNIKLYFVVGLILIPLGLWNAFSYQGKYAKELKISVAIFFLLYLSYGYNPMAYSGYLKGLLFGGRFMVPILPLFVIATGLAIDKYNWSKSSLFKYLLIAGAFICVGLSQYAGHRYNQTHYSISQEIYSKYKNKAIAIDHSGYTSIIRYINPQLGLFEKQADLNRFTDVNYVEAVLKKVNEVYILTSSRNENAEKNKRANRFYEIIENVKRNFSVEKMETLKSFDGNIVEVWRCRIVRQEGDSS